MQHSSPPQWAISEKRAMDALRRLSYWWYDRQDPDTGLGFEDDDVESILLSAPALALGQDDERARHAFHIVAEQMWYQWGVDGDKEIGYPVGVEASDVEHAAEPISNSQPLMALIDPGNPVYIDRCLISARNLLQWTAVNDAGHRHFKAFFFGAGRVLNQKYYDCDIPMNARATIPAVYAAWYTGNPQLISLLKEYADAWLEHALDDSQGKPYGVVPSEIRFSDDKVGAYSGRWDQIAGYRQFDWSSYHMSAYNMYYFFISMYKLTGEERYLEPVRETMKHLALNRGPEEASNYGAMYRSYTGFGDMDSLFEPLKESKPVWRWFLDGDKSALADWCDSFADDIDATIDKRTEKLDLRDGCANYETCTDDSVLRLMYSGGLGYHVGAFPHARVSWRGVDENFTALVLNADDKSLDVLVYNFSNEPRTAGMVVWNLESGSYTVKQGTANEDDVMIKDGASERQVDLEPWSVVDIELPPSTLRRIEVRQLKAGSRAECPPDLALSKASVISSVDAPQPGDEFELDVTVYNIGSGMAKDVVVEAVEMPSGRIISSRNAGDISASVDLNPSRTSVKLQCNTGSDAQSLELRVRSQDPTAEITTRNNTIYLAFDGLRTEKWVPNVHFYGDPPPPENPYELVAARRTASPGAEWTIEDPDWSRADAAVLEHRMYNDSNEIANRTEVRVSYDDTNLYIFYRCPDEDPKSMICHYTEHDSPMWDNESIELFIDPQHNHQFFYHFAVNPRGTMYDAETVSPFWNGDWTAGTFIDDHEWRVQIIMPFTTLGVNPKSGDVIGINFGRNNFTQSDRGNRETVVWQPIPGWTLRPAYFGHVTLE